MKERCVARLVYRPKTIPHNTILGLERKYVPLGRERCAFRSKVSDFSENLRSFLSLRNLIKVRNEWSA